MRNPYVVGSLAVIAAVVLVLVLAHWGRRAGRILSARQAKAKQRRDVTTTPWVHYSRPHLPNPLFWEVGVERVTSDGLVLNRVEIKKIDHNDLTERFDLEAQAINRAVEYNAAKAGM